MPLKFLLFCFQVHPPPGLGQPGGSLPGSVSTQPATVAPLPPAPSVQGVEVSDSEVDREDDTASVASEGHPEDIEEPEDLVSLNVQSKQDFKRVFRTLNVNFGDYFETQRVNRPYCNNPKGNIPLLVLDVGEDPSWFNPEGGYFKNSNLPPQKSAFFTP